MKNLILIIATIFIAVNIFAQRLPEQRTFHYWNANGDSVGSSLLQNVPYFQYPTDRFVLGWHWGEGKYMTAALKMNFIHCPIDNWNDAMAQVESNQYIITDPNGYYSRQYYADNCRMIMRSNWIGGHWAGWNPTHSRALHYIPTLQQTEISDTTIDATNGFLGFRNIDNTAQVADNSLILNKNTTNSGIVLSDNLIANRLELFQIID